MLEINMITLHTPKEATIKKIVLFLCDIRMPNLSLNELNQITKMRRIKVCKSMSKERLFSALDESECNSIESAVSGNNFDHARIKKDYKTFMKQKTKRIFLNQK